MKLGKNQIRIFILIGIATATMYYSSNMIKIGGNFSDGILAGFFLGITFICSISVMFLWGRMLYQNWKVRQR